MSTSDISDIGLSRRNRTIAVFLILFIQLLVSFLYLWLSKAPLMEVDSSGYLRAADNLRDSWFFSRDGINPEFYRTPGYPAFLAVFLSIFDNLLLISIIQAILIPAASFLVYKSVMLQTKNDYLAIVALALFGLDVNTYIFAAYIMTDILFMFLIALSLYLFCLWRENPEKLTPFITMTVTLLVSLMVRPVMMYFCILIIPVLIVCTFIKKITVKHMLVYVALFAVVFGGWSLRNYVHSEHFLFTTIRNVQFFRWDARILMEELDDLSREEATAVFQQELDERLNGRTDLSEVEIGLIQREIGNEYIFSHLPEYLRMNIRGLLSIFHGPTSETLSPIFGDGIMNFIIRNINYMYIYILCAVYAVGFIKNLVKKKLVITDIVLLLSVGYLAAGHASLGYWRYRLTLYPLLVVAAVILWNDEFTWLAGWFRQKVFIRRKGSVV